LHHGNLLAVAGGDRFVGAVVVDFDLGFNCGFSLIYGDILIYLNLTSIILLRYFAAINY
jgi:formylmethanofuran dehydrogenase subunit C